jgi:hypothetical protein
MKFIGKKLIFGLCAATVAVVACSTGTHQSPSQGPGPSPTIAASAGGTGEVGMSLTLPGGEHISRVDYVLTNTTNTYTGHYDITNTVTLSFTIGSVAAGTGYSLKLTATSDDGLVTCSFPAPGDPLISNITVVNRTTTTVNVNLQCLNNPGQDAGNVVVTASKTNCPVWNTIVANPLNITLEAGANVNDSGSLGSTAIFPGNTGVPAVINDGQSLVLVGSATGPNPTALTFTWTTTGGTLSSVNGTIDPNSNDAGTTDQTTFTCPASGPTTTFTVSLDLSDGQPFDAATCDPKWTHGTVQVTCSNPAPCGGQPFATSNTNALGLCTGNGFAANATDAAGFPFVPTSTTDPLNPADFCCVGACQDGALQTPTGTRASSIAQPESGYPAGTCTAPNALNNNGCCVPLLPCKSAADVTAAKCVKCQGFESGTGNNGGICTATDAAFVQKDITANIATVPGDDPSGGCYSCLAAAGCLDDTTFGDSGKECGDLTGSTNQSNCATTLSCILSNSCVWGGTHASSHVSTCYCGTAPPSGSCASAFPNGAANGICDNQIATGNGFPVTDGTNNMGHLTDATLASGKADQIFQCALSNSCDQCLH